MEEKFNIKIERPKIKSIIHEHVIKNKQVIHSFIIFLIKAEADVKQNKKLIIESDYKMINLKDKDLNMSETSPQQAFAFGKSSLRSEWGI